MSRFTIDPKSPVRPEDLAIILLHAGRKGKKPCARIYLLNQQIKIIREKYGPTVEIITVLGYGAEEIIAGLDTFVRIVENENFDNTSTARSALMGVRATTRNAVYIINGDVEFDTNIFSLEKNSHILSKPTGTDREVGIIRGGVHIESMAYGLLECPKWAGISFMQENELNLFKKHGKSGMLMHEVFNRIIDGGGRFILK